MRPVAPMLATRGAAFPAGGGWAWEPKLDGWRALVEVADGRLRVFTRHGNDVTAAVPELGLLADAAGLAAGAVLDGELVAGDGRAWSFYRLSGRMAAARSVAVQTASAKEPVTFVAFDMVSLGGADLTRRPLHERRALLATAVEAGPHWHVMPSWDADGPDVLAACERLGIEGAMAKRLDSPYRPGKRSDDWLKFKTATWRAEHAPRRLDSARRAAR